MRSYQGNGYRLLYDIVREPVSPQLGDVRKLSTSTNAVRQFQALQRLGHVPTDREAFCALLVNARTRPIGFHIISIGTLDTATVHPREVMRMAVIIGAAAMVLAHNHPSGDPSPSDTDRKVTKRMGEVGELLGIQILDHVVIGAERHYSFSSGRHHANA